VREQRHDKVLLVEDTAPSRYVVGRMLTDAGFEVVEARNGKEALDAAQTQPDLVVLDINLPDISGYEVCRRLKTDPKTSSIPVLHLSASYVKAEDYARGLNAGADGYLTHPVDDLVLVATVKAILRARRAEEASRNAEAEAMRLKELAESRSAELEKARNLAEAANRAKDQFLAVLSHELRTPLSPVFMIVASLEADTQVPQHVREQLSMIRRNIELETKLIDDLLDLSRITNNKLRLELAPISVNEVARHVLTVCASEIQDKHLRTKLQLAARDDTVRGDSARLHQSFWNLLKNAVKFTREHGLITVKTSNPEEGNVRFEVQDSGIGIPPEVLPKIFDAFEQGDANVSRQFGGLGLGLAISRAIIALHGGSMTASSPGKGEGATFAIALPTVARAAEPVQENISPDSAASKCGTVRLLVVEDHHDTAQALNRLLTSAGYSVKTVGSVHDALKLAETDTFDVVISDLGLPDESGHILMQQLRDKYGLPGIAMSGYGMEQDILRSKDSGFLEHLIKPVSIPQLDSTIRRVLNGQTK
jgi:signal transduction histidine kinase